MEIQYILYGIKRDYEVGEIKEIIGTFSSEKAAIDYFHYSKEVGSDVEEFKKQFDEQYEELYPIELIPYKHLKQELYKEQIEEYKSQNKLIQSYNEDAAEKNKYIKLNYSAKKYQYVLDCLNKIGYTGHETDLMEYKNCEVESVKFFG